MRDLPDIYAHVISNKYNTTVGTLNICRKLKETVQLICIATDANFDSGRLFQHFYNIPRQRFSDVSDNSHFDYGIV